MTVIRRTLWVAVVAMLALAPASSSLALVPMAGDKIVYDGPARLADSAWHVDFLQLVGQPAAGLYVAVAGVEHFRVLLNDTLVATSRPGPTPRTIIRPIDLSNDAGRLRPGWNRIKLEATEPADSFTVRVWTSRYSWYLGSPHSHTTYSDGMLSVHDLLEWAARDGGHYLAITDHNTLDQCADTAFRRFGRLEPIRGTEWTNWDSGHANLLGIEGQAMVPEQVSIRRMIDEAKYRGALIQICHPRLPDHPWRRYPVLDPGIDGIEVLNGLCVHDREAVAWWHDLLVAGNAIAGIGGSDFHGREQWERPLSPCSRVRAVSNHPDTLLRAFKLGRVMACDRYDGPRVYLYADTSDNGQWDIGMGEIVNVSGAAQPVRFRVEAESVLPNQELVVHGRHGELFRELLVAAGDYEREWVSLVCAADTGFVRAELRRANGRFAALTNPIYLNHRGYEHGPVELRSRVTTRSRFDTGGNAPPHDEELVRMEVRLENRRGYSPYEFGVAVALDTAHWSVVDFQRQGQGVGRPRSVRVDGHHILSWHGGYRWNSRLRVGASEALSYWVKARPRRPGPAPILHRSWAHDRLFELPVEPVQGQVGPDGHSWHLRLVDCDLDGVKDNRAEVRTPEELTVSGVTVTRGRVQLALDVPGGEAGPLRFCVIDMSGRVRLSQVVELPAGPGRSVTFSLTGSDSRRLPAGVYALRVTGPGRAVARRLVIAD